MSRTIESIQVILKKVGLMSPASQVDGVTAILSDGSELELQVKDLTYSLDADNRPVVNMTMYTPFETVYKTGD